MYLTPAVEFALLCLLQGHSQAPIGHSVLTCQAVLDFSGRLLSPELEEQAQEVVLVGAAKVGAK